MTLLHVAIGGALGAVLRYFVGMAVAFPLGTLVVNVAGSFIMGLVFVILAQKGLDRWQPLIMTGLLGGFTTFSAFSLDTLRLIEMGRWAPALWYVLASVCLSIGAIFLAVIIARSVSP